MPKNNFNFGKERIITERGRAYVQTVMFIFQFAMIFALTIKSYNPKWYWLVAIGIIMIVAMVLFVRFMRFDIERNIPAEYEWTWNMNPEWQKHKHLVEKIGEDVAEIKNEAQEWKQFIVKNAAKPANSHQNQQGSAILQPEQSSLL